MLKLPEFKVARSTSEVTRRLEQLWTDLLIAREHDLRREYRLRLYILQAKLTPEQVDERTSCGYTYSLRCAALAEALWLYGYRPTPGCREGSVIG
jgi:hypothetical protein